MTAYTGQSEFRSIVPNAKVNMRNPDKVCCLACVYCEVNWLTQTFWKKLRAVGDRVWVQYIEKESKEWFECEVTAVRMNSVTKKDHEYQVKLVEDGAPGTPYEDNMWLTPGRLHNERDRFK